jgi:acetolactate synthase-1/3 small subunit
MRHLRTLSVLTENRVGLLHRVTSVFTRRGINIESLTVSNSELPGIHRFTILVDLTREQAEKCAAQIEKQIEVIKAFVHDEHEVYLHDLALYKIAMSPAIDSPAFEELLQLYGARVVAREPEFVVLEKTGSSEDMAALLTELEPYEVLEFVRSGKVALTRPMKKLSTILQEFEEARRASW